ncbi:unnamed protein product [Penicillium salamii]|uniref:Amino acid/polyamine transporter I n=1 Tax=Penicillium salamii TaxID=1612424 RepID=A0A9W4IIF7_9EURO|nr:unnamed protein product [Penicillium salamii]CAG8289586.1 unnamed protein product [Penicillium salamii]CAG8420539.1 unnamed protein product [Penicillium salamii]CAG8421078.1 unnamed protein product [Penicillium salamii]
MNSKSDDYDLESRGYSREMPRQFSVFSLVALSFSLTCTWSGTGSSLGVAIQEASAAGAIWSIPVAGAMTAILSAGVAELASAFPVAGAQYYWTFCLSSKEYRSFASYINGWLSILGWWLASASACNFIASLLLSIAFLWYPDYEAKSWHQWLVYVGIVWLAVALNTFGSQILPLFNRFNFIVACCTLTATTITLFVCSRNDHAPATWVFGDTTNGTGWPSDGLAFVLAISTSVYAFLGTDCGAHLCEEIRDPAKNTPKIILLPILIGLGTAWPFACACMYAITDVQAVLDTPSGIPLIEIYYQSTKSKGASSVLLALFAFCFFGCTVANGTTCSRTIWAISRDGALPFSGIWSRVNPRFKIPLNALGLSATVISLYGLIFLGSTTAFSAMVGAAVIFLQTSCALPQAIVLWRGRDKVLPERAFSLGKLGPTINFISVMWVLFLDIVFFLPTERPVTKENMNYVSVVSAGLTLFVLGLYFFSKRGQFNGPRVLEAHAGMIEAVPAGEQTVDRSMDTNWESKK